MTIQIDLEPELERRLNAQAKLQGMLIERYARQVLQQAMAIDRGQRTRADRDGFRTFLDNMVVHNSGVTLVTAEAFSRETIYGGHD